MHRTPSHPARRVVGAMALATTALLAACGGGGDSGHADPAAQHDGVISGALVKGPVGAAEVCAYALVDGVQGDKRGCGVTDADGHYKLFVLSVKPGGESLVVAGTRYTGQYTDEATGTQRPLDATLRSAVRLHPGQAATVMVTPLTELAMRRAEAGSAKLADEPIEQAMAMVAHAFDTADIRQTLPADPTRPESASAARGARNYGLALAGVAHLRADLAPKPGAAVTVDHALAELAVAFRPDRVAGQDLKFKAAMQNFLAGPRNATGVRPAEMASALSLKLASLPLAWGVLPAMDPLGPEPVTPLPPVPTDGPACRVTVSQPAVGGSYYFAMQPHRFCVRRVEAAQCEVGTMQGLLRGDKLYNALQGPAFGMTEHAVEPVETCTTGADTTIDLS